MRSSVLSKVAGLGFALLAFAGLSAGTAAAGAPVQPDAAPTGTGGVGFRVDGDPGSQLVDGFIPLTGSPGQTLQGHFFITNTQGVSAPLTIYPSDGLTGVTTGVVYSDLGDPLDSAGNWVTPDRSVATVGAREEQLVNFTVTVPAGASAGDHVGGVVFEQRRPGSTATGAISQVVRGVVPIMIEVPGAAGPQINVKSAAITTLPGSPLLAVTVTLRNTGLKLCRPQLSVTIGGNNGGTQTRQLDTILPGDQAPYPMPWPTKLASGSYLVHVVAGGCGATDTLDVTLSTPRSQEENTPNKTSSSSPKVVTDAIPGTQTFTPGNGKKTSKGSGKKHKKLSVAGVAGAATIGGLDASGGGGGNGGASAGGAKGAASGNGAGAKKGLLPRLSDAVSAVAKHVPAIAERATIPLSFLLLVGLLFFAQEAFDRRDPKLALAPLHREQDLPFDPDPLGVARLIPSPTDLSPESS